ncbi:protein-glutamate O-methyltransferase CheR [Roseisolibacter sp. H3M3-2]|uniref:CheR family methyltransferase n=1 Tax=Roseisolibacter sp. H3M3-2 TaxID=3031323 RepID=UPI0023DA53F0|nr:protein-glutamate O-methyltransferase CheR [Roseisolibacter sp. H3M3-2]MDF1506249.1 protein-glutamate O-methyltransferase CheR [Roseisolibacter sp. H3M3-2]
MLEPVTIEDPEGFAALCAKIVAERGFRCTSYKQRCLVRRIGVRLRAVGVHTFADYMRVLDADPREWDRLLDALTINVTKLFRNWEAWETLATRVVPALWARPDDELCVWSAGSSSGEEAYSLAALFHRHAERLGQLDRIGRVRVLGTDIDRDSLAAATRGVYAEAAFADTPDDLRARYFGPGPHAHVAPELRAMVAFERRDLLREPPPPGRWHLIACRNVVIYFDRESQEDLFLRFHDALAPGGVLFLGKVETLLGPVRSLVQPLEPRDRVFRRP